MSRAEFVGWGGIAPITMLIENIIGLTFNAERNEVTFRLNQRGACGLENMIFNSNRISVVCTEYKPFQGETVIEVEAEKPFRLTVVTKYLWDPVVLDVPAGKTTYRV